MTKEKYQKLIKHLGDMKKVAIAFSGGVDSTFLIAAAAEAMGPGALAVIAKSPTYPKREYDEAVELARSLGVSCEVVETNELADPAFAMNPPSRCYACKTELFHAVKKVADERGIKHVLLGNNADDAGDFRPGMAAAKKLGATSPLLELGFTKTEIRELSREMGLKTWNKPAMACLSSRIPYGQEINVEKLNRIERAENAVRDMGIIQLRVRDHGEVARIEVEQKDIEKLTKPSERARLVAALKDAGYSYVCLDLEGYRTGAMNEILSQSQMDVNGKSGDEK
jgi:uncharacterized protein